MADSILNAALKRTKLLSQTIEALDKKLESFPDGRINVGHHKGGVHFILIIGNAKVRYMNKNDKDLIELLIQKEYIKKVLISAEKESAALNKFIKAFPDVTAECVYDHLSEERKRIAKPIIVGDDQYTAKWLAEPYKRKPFSKDAPKFYTLKGERVRSKSEVIIADRLYAKGIPYKYECPLKVGKEVIHPDFTILRMSDRKVLYHEHCGKMGDPDYTKDIPGRANKYMRNGIFQGDRLFYTFESADCPLDVKALDDFIEKNYR